MNSRSSNVDLAKFIGSMLIMACHLNVIDFKLYDFYNFWIYVEFFLVITGYYSAKHFDSKVNNNPFKESVIYTLKKFIPFLPYTLFFSFVLYLIKIVPDLLSGVINIKGATFIFLEGYFFDNLFIANSYHHPLLSPTWFLSAMFIVFPLFTLILQIHNRYMIIIINAMYTLLYYGIRGIVSASRTHGYESLLRVFAGLCLGAFIYEMVYVFNDYINKVNKALLTVIEIITFIFPIIIICRGFSSPRLILLCHTICLSLMLSGVSYTSRIKGGKFFTYLGKLSTCTYIIHIVISNSIILLEKRIVLTDIYKCLLHESLPNCCIKEFPLIAEWRSDTYCLCDVYQTAISQGFGDVIPNNSDLQF